MSRSLNKVMLIGNVGGDPEIRTTPSGIRIAKVSLATNRRQKNGDEWTDVPEWHNLEFWDKLADVVEQWVKKGSQLYVEGRIKYDKWTDDQGTDKYWTSISVSEMVMLGSSGQTGTEYRTPPDNQGDTGGSSGKTVTDTDDDLPF